MKPCFGRFSTIRRLSTTAIASRMYRDGKLFHDSTTEVTDGAMEDFEVKYVFGVDPCQPSYMVEFDREADIAEDEMVDESIVLAD